MIPYDKLTHINYAFLIPNEDGSFQELLNTWKIGELVTLGAPAKRQSIDLGGRLGLGHAIRENWRPVAARGQPLSKTWSRSSTQYQFDGADIDWEYPDAGRSSQNFLALMQELRAALPKDKLLTAAVVALGEHGAGIPVEAFALMDFVNIMAYDNVRPRAFVVGLCPIRPGLLAWSAVCRLKKPPWGCRSMPVRLKLSYAQIVKDDPAAAQLDSTIYDGIQINYNGIPTIQAKTRLAMQRASGIMFWTLENDASGDLEPVISHPPGCGGCWKIASVA